MTKPRDRRKLGERGLGAEEVMSGVKGNRAWWGLGWVLEVFLGVPMRGNLNLCHVRGLRSY